MQPSPSDLPPEPDSARPAEPVQPTADGPDEAPLALPVRPGPNILMASLWWLVMLGVQIVVSIAAAVVIVIIGMATLGPQKFQAEMQKPGSTALFDLPGAILVFFLAATGGTFLAGAAITGFFYRGAILRRLALRKMSFYQVLLVIVLAPPTALVAGELASRSGKILPRFGENEVLFSKLAAEPWILVLLCGAVLPGLGEELFCRGFLGRGLVARHGVWLGTLFTALLFGLLHLDPPQVVGTTILGIGFQLAYLSSKSLWAPILFHTLNNSLAFVMMRLSSQPQIQQALGFDENTSLPPLLFAAALIAAFAVGWLLYETRTRWILPDGSIWSPGYVTAESPPVQLAAVARLRTPSKWSLAIAVLAYAGFVGVLIWEIMKLLK
jgi:membrane protease YdiL (CAAX protease family)